MSKQRREAKSADSSFLVPRSHSRHLLRMDIAQRFLIGVGLLCYLQEDGADGREQKRMQLRVLELHLLLRSVSILEAKGHTAEVKRIMFFNEPSGMWLLAGWKISFPSSCLSSQPPLCFTTARISPLLLYRLSFLSSDDS